MSAYFMVLAVIALLSAGLAHHLTPSLPQPRRRRAHPLISLIRGLLSRPVLIAMRYEEMRTVHANTDVRHVCHQCGHLLAIPPSGQSVLKEKPHAKLTCSHCKPNWTEFGYAPGAIAELGQRISSPAH